ncbi:hypothetical protein PC129_g12142 [Phytophthora cactorum]|uniref:Uncharacterized protein n=1 Tax=Phytophthora cactorum TaxID=29920 RepID=A0A8T0YHX4_9STRA|nr:hypothetical protein Pcac1_g22113 [Phytophthora cactorum]KAG2814533.1 hypothetical protein PC111_g13945 [Phytophthora cactorum]KAG2814680.1 hypothetical protein PC112_g14221 [Phytophthora cactorum]KAG2852265.1 hypothetical protein PC113_g15169 [Phytophthora cactorum]KAG2895586.1 hypothetical protein PC114_g15431 [Phytophthora cactorum]
MTNTLPACTGVFMRAHCPHPRLFEEEYKRSNRNRGTKILRCFPHCCPHHVDRSYCGSSLEVVLRFGSESDEQDSRSFAPFDIANVLVFARFEVDGKPLSGLYSLRYLRSVSQSEANPEGSWIEGVRQTTADRQQHSQQLQPPSRSANSQENTQPESATFVLNGQAYAKWYYHWGSGANKIQRATKHVLKAYVFYQTRALGSVQAQPRSVEQDQARDETLELLYVVTSPPFTVVSYRRAPLDASTGLVGPGTDATSMVPHYATDTAHPVDSRLRSLVQHQISRAFQEYNQQQRQRGGSLDEPMCILNDQDENRVRSEVRGPLDRYRQLQEREGLRFRLLTPEHAAQSGSSLHRQIQTRGPRLVFDSTTRGDDHQHWRDTSKDEGEEFRDEKDEDDTRGDAAPHSLAPIWTASDSEAKVSGPVGVPPSTTDPIRHAEQAANIALRRFKLQQQQFDSHQHELQQLTDLAIIHYFASRVTTNNAGSLVDLEVVFTLAISQHWRYASSGATHLARLLLSIAKGERSHDPTVARSISGRDQLMLVLAEVCVWAFSPGNIELVQSLLAACHPLLLENVSSGGSGAVDDGKELCAAFLECVGRCWGALDRFLQSPRATQTIRSVRELSDAVLGVVYSDPELERLRSGLRTMLQRPTIVLEDSKENMSAGSDAYEAVIPRCNLAGWQSFVAQVREGYLRDQYSGRASPWSPMQGTSRWTADWLLQPDSLSVTPCVGRASDRTQGGNLTQAGGLADQDIPSMWTSCLALSQLLHLKLAVAGDPLHTLYVQAEPSVLYGYNAWLRLICDGRVRVASVAPNGLTSLMGSGFGGDYVAYRLEQQESSNYSICVVFYWWPGGGTQKDRLTAFRSGLTLKTAASAAFMEVHMELERGFVERQAIAAAEFPELELWSPTERVQAVASWEPWLSIEGIYARKGGS